MKDQGNYVPLDTLPSFELFAAKYPDAYTWETLNPVDGNGIPCSPRRPRRPARCPTCIPST